MTDRGYCSATCLYPYGIAEARAGPALACRECRNWRAPILPYVGMLQTTTPPLCTSRRLPDYASARPNVLPPSRDPRLTSPRAYFRHTLHTYLLKFFGKEYRSLLGCHEQIKVQVSHILSSFQRGVYRADERELYVRIQLRSPRSTIASSSTSS